MFSTWTCCGVFILWALLGTAYASHSPMYLAFSAKRNSSGYWIVKMDMDHSYGVGWQASEAFEAAVDVTTKTCRQGELFDFTIHIKGPLRAAPRGEFPGFRLPSQHDSALAASGNATASWQRAAQICRERRAQLAVVNTVQDLTAVIQSLQDRDARAYIGIRNHHGTLIDQYGPPVDVESTLMALSYNPDVDACYSVTRSYFLFPRSCELKFDYICERRFA